jgi:ubiquinone biosynthesis protein UbiJ
MIPLAFTSFVNHLLRQQSWARDRLAAHAGSRLCLRARPLLADINFLIAGDGLISADTDATPPDLLVTLKPAAIPLVLRRHPDAMKNLELAGNAGLASAVQDLFARLEWDAEEDLSLVVGDIAANRIARTARGIRAWQRDAFERTAQNVAEYLTEENPLVARRAEFNQFRLDAQALESQLDGVQARVDALLRRARVLAD